MTKTQKKTLVSLLLLLAVLLVAVLGVRSCKAKEAETKDGEQATQSDNVPTKGGSFTTIAYDNSRTNLSFAKNTEDVWIWADDPDFPLDGTTLDRLSQLITNLDPMQTITEGDTMEAYGLENPSATITATGDDGAQTVLLLGKELSDGSYYLKTADSDIVYVVSSALHEHINKGIYELAALEEFPILTLESLRSVTIAGAQTLTLTPEKGTDGAIWRDDTGEAKSGEVFPALTAEVAALAFTSCVDYNPSAQAASICGFDSPAAVVTAVYLDEKDAEKTMTLSIGGVTTDAAGRYARLNDSTTIHRLELTSVDTLLSLAASGLPS